MINVTRIKENFILEVESSKSKKNINGYITEKGEVFLVFKGNPVGKEEFSKRALSIMGLVVTSAGINTYLEAYDRIAYEYGFKDSLDKDENNKGLMETNIKDDKDNVSENNLGNQDNGVVYENKLKEEKKKGRPRSRTRVKDAPSK